MIAERQSVKKILSSKKKERGYSRKRELIGGGGGAGGVGWRRCNSRLEGFKSHAPGPSFHLLRKQKPATIEWLKSIIPAVGR